MTLVTVHNSASVAPSEMLLEFYGKSFSPAKKIGNILFPDDVTTEDVVLNMPLLSSTTLKPVMDAKLSQKCGFDPAMRMGLSRRFITYLFEFESTSLHCGFCT